MFTRDYLKNSKPGRLIEPVRLINRVVRVSAPKLHMIIIIHAASYFMEHLSIGIGKPC